MARPFPKVILVSSRSCLSILKWHDCQRFGCLGTRPCCQSSLGGLELWPPFHLRHFHGTPMHHNQHPYRCQRWEFQLADNTFSLTVPNRTIETSIVRSVNRYRPNTSSRIRVNECACVKPLAKPKPEQQPEPNQHLWLNRVLNLHSFSVHVFCRQPSLENFYLSELKVYCQWLYRLLTCQNVYWLVLILMFVWPSTLKGAEGGSFKSLPWTISVPPWTLSHPKFSMGRWCSPAGNHLPKPFSNQWCQNGPQSFQMKPSCATWQLETLPQTIRAQHAQKTTWASAYHTVSVCEFQWCFCRKPCFCDVCIGFGFCL